MLANTRLRNLPLEIGSVCWVRDPEKRALFAYPVEIVEDNIEEPKTKEEFQKDQEITEVMTTYGGPFVKKLAELYRLGDPVDKRKLREAFPEYWAKYALIAELKGDKKV